MNLLLIGTPPFILMLAAWVVGIRQRRALRMPIFGVKLGEPKTSRGAPPVGVIASQ